MTLSTILPAVARAWIHLVLVFILAVAGDASWDRASSETGDVVTKSRSDVVLRAPSPLRVASMRVKDTGWRALPCTEAAHVDHRPLFTASRLAPGPDLPAPLETPCCSPLAARAPPQA